MKASIIVLFLLISLTLSGDTEEKMKRFCLSCEENGKCPLICKKYLQENYCDKCVKEGYCPLTCRDYLVKKFEKECDKCESKGFCPLECKAYFLLKNADAKK